MTYDTAGPLLNCIGAVALLVSGSVAPDLPVWLNWLRYVLWTTYGYGATLANEVSRLPNDEATYSECSLNDGFQGIEGNRIGVYIEILVGITVLVMVLCWGSLAFLGWRRRL